jgi:hypothetical protein
MNRSELCHLYLASSYDAAESSSSFICTVESTKLLCNKKGWNCFEQISKYWVIKLMRRFCFCFSKEGEKYYDSQ